MAEIIAIVLQYRAAAEKTGEISERVLTTIPIGWRLDRDGFQDAADVVQQNAAKGGLLDVLGDDQQGSFRLPHHFEDRHKLIELFDLAVIEQHVRVSQLAILRVLSVMK